ncbi:hypothetical protein SJZ64_26965, partial [Klebsiella pneumoniae]|nr:hypothetical protein [Klebsiella pneumoniae]
SAQIREILISESAWEEMTCLFAPSLVVPLSAVATIVSFRFSLTASPQLIVYGSFLPGAEVDDIFYVNQADTD